MPPAFIAAVVSGVVLLALYLSTAAPDLTFWDASELATAAHTLGIPHPPGTPLWVLLAHAASRLFATAGPARAVTLLSVAASALAGALAAGLVHRWVGTRAAIATAVGAGAMTSVWANATEVEVYAVVLLVQALVLVISERAGRLDTSMHAQRRWRALLVFCLALAVPLHLSVLVVLPAALVFAWRGPVPRLQDVLGWGALVLLALSAVAVLPLLSAQHPVLDSGHPVTWAALRDLLLRRQYQVAGLWPRQAPLWLQIGNVLEWADWQVAFGMHPVAGPAWARTSLTVCWGWLSALGIWHLHRLERRAARGLAVLIVSATVGVVLWLNLKAGPSFGAGVLPIGAGHEARERDYFLALGFWAWGLAAGIGMCAVGRSLAARFGRVAAPLPLLLVAIPVVVNRDVMDRTRIPMAQLPRVVARELLDAVPYGGVLFTAGDNDTFPLWYLQQVEEIRPDVQVVTIPLLGAETYRADVLQRLGGTPTLRPEAWPGLPGVLVALALQAEHVNRSVRVSAFVDAPDRRAIAPAAGWQLEGMVYAPDRTLPPGTVALNVPVMQRAAARVPTSVLAPIPAGADPAMTQMQALLRCASIRDRSDPLLVGACDGG